MIGSEHDCGLRSGLGTLDFETVQARLGTVWFVRSIESLSRSWRVRCRDRAVQLVVSTTFVGTFNSFRPLGSACTRLGESGHIGQVGGRPALCSGLKMLRAAVQHAGNLPLILTLCIRISGGNRESMALSRCWP